MEEGEVRGVMDTSLVEEGGVDGDLPEDVLRHGV
jgi:hypothetical protein